MPIASTRSHRDEREALLPPALVPLFDDRVIASCDLLDDYVARLVAAMARTLGLDAACREPASADQAVVRAGLVPEVASVPVAWALAMLAARGWVASSGNADGVPRY